MNKKVDITFSSVREFMYALMCAGQETSEELPKEDFMDSSDKEECISEWESMMGNFSSYMRNEIKYFFGYGNNCCDNFGQLIYDGFLVKYPDIESPYEIINLIENEDCINIVRYLTQRLYYEVTSRNDSNSKEWEEIQNSISAMVDVVRTLEFENAERKEKALEILENIEESKQRLLMVLKGFYNKYYKLNEERIKNKLKPVIEKYRSQLYKDKEKFFMEYSFKDAKTFEENLKIHISYYKYSGSDYWARIDGQNEWMIIGYAAYKGVMLRDNDYKEKILNFLKSVSDKKRLEIIQMLKKRPHYVNEIAEKMNMTAPTASYHLTALQELGIVTFERVDHKFYYEINLDTLKQLFEEAGAYYIS